ncbi:hypothetical protein DACRYDRAFT_20662 [Dacryopinax primogenitus]|uniref:Methyltransferase domain-containing protein n=1 Tax=Dacryopinax primogenitus (strain DJM 731) TaxID=1858805 RepID=M5GGA0_DACPD|nr:uncharacterized protein DACRYDRAFT_20662 [Dacryopinax primogenitus]EJU05123.1 hypothetical protein DACRYDRAFT_20662 [Dacryopinax primogenitus]
MSITSISAQNGSKAERGDSTGLHFYQAFPLNKDILNLTDTELAFFKHTTGIQNETELKEHICHVQEEAYKVFPYPCIRNFNFTKLKISRLPPYPQMMELVRNRPDAIYLDIGCCFGNDARKAVVDGYPMQNIICSDLRPQYWDLGFELFRDKDTFHVPFIAGDAFDPDFLSPTLVEKSGPDPALKEVKTLTELQGNISVIHASSFFHLFDEEHQERLAYLTASLLLKKPGTMIFGSHGGLTVPGIRNERGAYGHSPESWTQLWETVLGKGNCEVKAELRAWKTDTEPDRAHEVLTWCVTLS